MTGSLLIYNERSGRSDPALLAEIEALFADAGRPIGRKLALGDEDLPTAASARAEGLDLVVTLSGDGSMSSVADRLGGWNGTLLVLPGGTMNLLSHALHGDLTAPEVVTAHLAGKGSVLQVPVLRAGDLTAYTGIIIGPTAAWGDVREDLRNLDVAALAANVPRALAATFKEPGVVLDEHAGEYPAIFVEPGRTGLRAYGVLASSAGDLFGHGWAWLSGDFRNGPSEPLGTARNMRFRTGSARLHLLVDGEKEEAPNLLDVYADKSRVRFHAVLGDVAWP